MPTHRLCLPLIAAGVAYAACLVVGIAGCGTPTGPTVTMAAGKAVLPADGTVVAGTSQPVTLTVQNAVTTAPNLPVTDTFEIATDSAFGHIVVTKTIPQGAGGQTSLTLDPLQPSTYFWRVRASAGGAIVTSTSGTFRIAVVLQAPVLASPASGVLVGHLNQPITLVIQNPASSTPVSGVTDGFDVATDAAFTNVVVSRNVSQTANGPTTLVLDPLPAGAAYYWRVRVTAPDAIAAVSATASFKVGPAIVSGPYQLAIDGSSAAYCGAWLFPHLFVIDGNLTVSTQGWVFTQPPNDHNYPQDLALRVTLSGSRVMGSLVANLATARELPNGYWEVTVSKSSFGQPGNFPVPVDISGVVNTDGSVTGAFDGFFRRVGTFLP